MNASPVLHVLSNLLFFFFFLGGGGGGGGGSIIIRNSSHSLGVSSVSHILISHHISSSASVLLYQFQPFVHHLS